MVRRKSDVRSRSTTRTTDTNASKTVVLVDGNRKKSSYVRALREIRTLRKTVNLLIPKAPFARLVKEIIMELSPEQQILRIQLSALEALQEATEAYIVQFFEDSVLLSMHAKRVTLMRQDMILMRRLRGRNDIINR